MSNFRKTAIILLGFLIFIPTYIVAELPSDLLPYPAELFAQCYDGIDNDGDGFTDLEDRDCPRCFDGIDNDGDTLIDSADPDCPAYWTGRLGQGSGEVLGVFDGSKGTRERDADNNHRFSWGGGDAWRGGSAW